MLRIEVESGKIQPIASLLHQIGLRVSITGSYEIIARAEEAEQERYDFARAALAKVDGVINKKRF